MLLVQCSLVSNSYYVSIMTNAQVCVVRCIADDDQRSLLLPCVSDVLGVTERVRDGNVLRSCVSGDGSV